MQPEPVEDTAEGLTKAVLRVAVSMNTTSFKALEADPTFKKEDFLAYTQKTFIRFVSELGAKDGVTTPNAAMRNLATSMIEDLTTLNESQAKMLIVRGKLWSDMAKAVASVALTQGIVPEQNMRHALVGFDGFRDQTFAQRENAPEIRKAVEQVAEVLEVNFRPGSKVKDKPGHNFDETVLPVGYTHAPSEPVIPNPVTIMERVDKLTTFSEGTGEDVKKRAADVGFFLMTAIDNMEIFYNGADEKAAFTLVRAKEAERQNPTPVLRMLGDAFTKFSMRVLEPDKTNDAMEDLCITMIKNLVTCDKVEHFYAQQFLWMRAAELTKMVMQQKKMSYGNKLLFVINENFLDSVEEFYTAGNDQRSRIMKAMLTVARILEPAAEKVS